MTLISWWCMLSFVPFLKYAWGNWAPSYCQLRLLPPFIFPDEACASDATPRVSKERELEVPVGLSHAALLDNSFAPPFFKCQSSSPGVLKLGGEVSSSPHLESDCLNSPFSDLKPQWPPYSFEIHQTLSCHRPFAFALHFVSNAFPQVASWGCHHTLSSLCRNPFLRGPFLVILIYWLLYFISLFPALFFFSLAYSIFYLFICYRWNFGSRRF